MLPIEVSFLRGLSPSWHREWKLNGFFIVMFGWKWWSDCLKSVPFPYNYFPVNTQIQTIKLVTSETSGRGWPGAPYDSKTMGKINLPSFWLSATTALTGQSGSSRPTSSVCWWRMSVHTAGINLSSLLWQRSYKFTLWDFFFFCLPVWESENFHQISMNSEASAAFWKDNLCTVKPAMFVDTT